MTHNTEDSGQTSPSQTLLNWYDRNKRAMPWRDVHDPYKTWLSEIMLQQTTVVTVGPYFVEFIKRWPTVDALARADLDEVLHAWQGLGYYARARNLHKCAKLVADKMGGKFPNTQDGLSALPGIGPYTAGAIAAIAFGRKATAVDGNVERVMARLHRVTTPLPEAKKQLTELTFSMTPDQRCGDFVQALMDLGATVCTPRKPACGICPWRDECQGRKAENPENYPVRPPKKEKPTRYGTVFWAVRKDGSLLLRRRPEKGLLGGMIEVPSTEWTEKAQDLATVPRKAPISALWKPMDGVVRHTFTHFKLELRIMVGKVQGNPPVDGIWCRPEDLKNHALPTVMKKVVRHAVRK